MTTRYVIRDTATEGADFLVWGDDCPDEAQIELDQCKHQGLRVELLTMPADQMDERTRRQIEGDKA